MRRHIQCRPAVPWRRQRSLSKRHRRSRRHHIQCRKAVPWRRQRSLSKRHRRNRCRKRCHPDWKWSDPIELRRLYQKPGLSSANPGAGRFSPKTVAPSARACPRRPTYDGLRAIRTIPSGSCTRACPDRLYRPAAVGRCSLRWASTMIERGCACWSRGRIPRRQLDPAACSP